MFRVIGLPGDKIAVNSGQLTLNGIRVARAPQGTIRRQVPERWETLSVYSETLPEGLSYEVAESPTPGRFDEIPETAVAAGAIYVLGDNRDYADDSRSAQLGDIPLDHIVGRVVFRLRPDPSWLVPPETVPGLG